MNDWFSLVTNACFLIALSYLALKMRNINIVETYERLLVPLLSGLASVLLMTDTIDTEWGSFDLRFAPIVMVGLIYGALMALFASVFPAIFTLIGGDPMMEMHIIQELIIPALISSLFRQREYRYGWMPIKIANGVKICVLLFFSRLLVKYNFINEDLFRWGVFSLFIFVVYAVSVLILIAMYNDEHRNWLLQRQLELKANQDLLTRLPNTRSFMEICKSTLSKRRIAIMMIDIDNFKNYNDTLGHLQGDQLLQGVGNMLRNAIGERDYIARYGGEEFIVMCYSTELASLNHLAQKLCDAVANHPFYGKEVQPHKKISISIGIALAQKAGDDLHKIISRADEALYESKRTGKNKYSFSQGA